MSKLELDYGNPHTGKPTTGGHDHGVRSVSVGPRHCCRHHCVCPDNPNRAEVCISTGETIDEIIAKLAKSWG